MESKTWFGSQEVDGSDHGLAASDGASIVVQKGKTRCSDENDSVSTSWEDLFVKTETISRAVIENEEYLARHSTGRDFRRGTTIFSARSSSHSMSRFTTAGTFSSGRQTIECGALDANSQVDERFGTRENSKGSARRSEATDTSAVEFDMHRKVDSLKERCHNTEGDQQKSSSLSNFEEQLRNLSESKALMEKELKELKQQLLEVTDSKASLEKELDELIVETKTKKSSGPECQLQGESSDSIKKQLGGMNDSKALMENELKELRKQLSDVTDSKSSLEKELKELRSSTEVKKSKGKEGQNQVETVGNLRRQLSDVNDSKTLMEKELKELRKQLADVNDTKVLIENELKETKKQLGAVNDSNTLIERELMKQLSDVNDAKALMETELKELRKQLSDVAGSKSSLEKELKELRKQPSDVADSKSSLEKELKELRKQPSDVNDSKTLMEKELKELRKQLADVNDTKVLIENELKETKKQLGAVNDSNTLIERELMKQLSDVNDAKALMETELKELRKQLSDVAGSKSSLEKELKELRKQLSDVTGSKSSLEKELKELRKQLSDVAGSKSSLEKELKELRKQPSDVAGSKSSLEKELKELRKQLSDVAGSKSSLEKELKELRKQLSDVADSKSSLEKELKELRKQLSDVAGSKSSLEKELKELRKQPSDVAGSKSSLEKELKELRKQLSDVAGSKSSLEKELKELRKQLAEEHYSKEAPENLNEMEGGAKFSDSFHTELGKLKEENAVLMKELNEINAGRDISKNVVKLTCSPNEKSCSADVDFAQAKLANFSEGEGSCSLEDALDSSYDTSVVGAESGLAEDYFEFDCAVHGHSELGTVLHDRPSQRRRRSKRAVDGEFCHTTNSDEGAGENAESYNISALQSLGAPIVLLLRKIKAIERDIQRCGKVVSQIAPCIKEARHFKRVMQLAERHSDSGDNYGAHTELQAAASDYKRRVMRAEGIWKRQDENLRLLQARIDAVGEELDCLMVSPRHEHCEGSGESRVLSSGVSAPNDLLQQMQDRVRLMLFNVRKLLDDMHKQRQNRHEAMLAALQRCSPAVAAAYVQEGGISEWKEAAAFSASAVGMLVLAVGSIMFGRYELR
ncbi:Proteasome Maturation Protein 17 [Trypanosoma brucei equiperdum]|uniref:Proteasome Maturation Protein 17 n=1 Tax=Trypanosoma brucei equiperdum TaxID=630700 RepID=A0A3L6KUJ0_9TRYP|nr:Proteasome Maturation Protein 17 [Trypanosoma brucei equiperdum]